MINLLHSFYLVCKLKENLPLDQISISHLSKWVSWRCYILIFGWFFEIQLKCARSVKHENTLIPHVIKLSIFWSVTKKCYLLSYPNLDVQADISVPHSNISSILKINFLGPSHNFQLILKYSSIHSFFLRSESLFYLCSVAQDCELLLSVLNLFKYQASGHPGLTQA